MTRALAGARRAHRIGEAETFGGVKDSFRLEPVFDFIRTLWLLNHRLETTSRHMMRTIGLTGPQRMLLRVVGSNPGIAAGALAETLHVHPGTLSSALRRLEARRLLVRTPDARDLRRIRIDLTPAGRRLDRPMDDTVESAVRAALAELPERQVWLARQVLRVVSRHLSGAGDSDLRRTRASPARRALRRRAALTSGALDR